MHIEKCPRNVFSIDVAFKIQLIHVDKEWRERYEWYDMS